MRCAGLILSVALLGAPVAAQPLAATCYSPDRGGWVGPSMELGCLPCCGCRSNPYSMEWQYRPEAAAWGGQPTSSVTGRYASGPFQGLTHLERYCMRMRFSDDAGPGLWGPTNGTGCSDAGVDLCFTWDAVRPSAPTLLDGGVVAGTNRVQLFFAPSTDDGGGVARYVFRFLPSGSGPAVSAFGSGTTSPISDILGAGTYTVALIAEDRALNISPQSAPLTVTLGFDASVPPPAAPAWPVTVSRDEYIDVMWPDDGADSWVVTQRGLDGGFGITARARVTGLGALLPTPGPCRLHAARIARVVGDQVSDWSPPSPDVLIDTVAPIAPRPQVVSVDGGLAILSWPQASDGCPSGLTYRLERSVNGGAFTLRTMTAATTFSEPVAAPGEFTWRLVAIDGAGNEGVSDGGASVVLVVDAGEPDAGEPDAGRVDAGPPDAGPGDAGLPGVGMMDAGTIDAGSNDAGAEDAGLDPLEPRALTVSCGCSSSEGGLLLLLAVWLARRSAARR